MCEFSASMGFERRVMNAVLGLEVLTNTVQLISPVTAGTLYRNSQFSHLLKMMGLLSLISLNYKTYLSSLNYQSKVTDT